MEPTVLGAAAYSVILLISIAGLFGLHWLTLLLGSSALALISFVEHRQYQTRFAAVGMSDVFQTFALSNVATSIVAATASYALGRVVGISC